MKKYFLYKITSVLCVTLIIMFLHVQKSNSQTFCIKPEADQITGVKDGFRYELWNQNSQGTACMTIGSGALFSGEWNGILNYLARRGLGYDQTQEHQEYGTFYATYDCEYNPSSESGNSYLSIYGWTVDPLVEYYIIEDWRNWIPSMAGDAVLKGTITVNDGEYDIYQTTRVNQPSIVGNTTFPQYFSIRKNKRNKGTINISDHFEKWESLGMEMGKLHEVSFVVEGYQSNGSFEFKALDIYVNNETVQVEEDAALPESLKNFPNPSRGNVSIQLNKAVSGANINIYDNSGRVIFSEDNINKDLIHVTNLESGIYFVSVNSNSLTYNSKLLVY